MPFLKLDHAYNNFIEFFAISYSYVLGLAFWNPPLQFPKYTNFLSCLDPIVFDNFIQAVRNMSVFILKKGHFCLRRPELVQFGACLKHLRVDERTSLSKIFQKSYQWDRSAFDKVGPLNWTTKLASLANEELQKNLETNLNRYLYTNMMFVSRESSKKSAWGAEDKWDTKRLQTIGGNYIDNNNSSLQKNSWRCAVPIKRIL